MMKNFPTLLLFIFFFFNCKRENKVFSSATANNKRKLPEVWRWKSEDKSQEFTLKILKITRLIIRTILCSIQQWAKT
ncbi:hypothetical protein CQ046_14530 [Chryseobacterium sp. MYb7]|nr:hypothetical protein CQ046_14530 [Chryseobacterium sp. MYb7]